MGSSRDPNSSFWSSWSHSSEPPWRSATNSDQMQTSAPNPECPDLFQQQPSSIMTSSTPNPSGVFYSASQVTPPVAPPWIPYRERMDQKSLSFVSGNVQTDLVESYNSNFNLVSIPLIG